MASPHKNVPAAYPGTPKKSKKKTIILTIVIITAVLLVACGVFVAINWNRYQQQKANDRIVAECNGFEIPYEELRFVTMFYKDSLATEYGKDIWDTPETAEKHRKELYELVHEHLNENYVVLSACRKLSIPMDSKDADAYVKSEMKDLREAFNHRKEYREWLNDHWMSESYMRFSIKVSFLESAIYYTMLDNKLFAYRQDNINEFLNFVETSGNYVRTIHIYIENVEGEDPEENFKKAQEISKELQSTDLAMRRDLMEKYIGSTVNDDLQNITKDGYYFTMGEMEEAYEKAAFDLDIGEVSDPVKCSGGNFILMRLELDPAYIMRNAQKLLNNYHSVALGLYEDQFRPECVVRFNDYGKSIDLVAMQ